MSLEAWAAPEKMAWSTRVRVWIGKVVHFPARKAGMGRRDKSSTATTSCDAQRRMHGLAGRANRCRLGSPLSPCQLVSSTQWCPRWEGRGCGAGKGEPIDKEGRCPQHAVMSRSQSRILATAEQRQE